MKKAILSIIISAMIISITATSFSGCGCSRTDTATTDEAKISVQTYTTDNENATEPATLSSTDTAIVNSGLTVGTDGKVVDSNGKEVKTTLDGKVEVKTADGKTVKVDANAIKSVNNTSKQNNDNKGGSSGNGSTDKKTNNNYSSGNVSSSSSKPKTDSKNNNPSLTQASNKPASSSTQNNKKPSNSQSSTADPHAGKTYHEAVYKTVNHPAITHEEPVYEKHGRTICNDCGADITGNVDHIFEHIENDQNAKGSYHDEWVKVQVGTKTVVDKEAWTEKILVKEAGWY